MSAMTMTSLNPAMIGLFVATTLAFVLLGRLLMALFQRYITAFQASVEPQLEWAFLFIDWRRLLIAHGLLVALVVVIGLLAMPDPRFAWLPALAMVGVPRWWLVRLRHRREAALRQQLPDTLAQIAGSLRAGAALGAALAEAAAHASAPMQQELRLVLREQRLGQPLSEALAGLVHRMPMEETRLFVGALQLGVRAGGAVADSLLALAGAQRQALLLARKVDALTAQGRLQAWVMGLLPFVVLLAMGFLDPTLVMAFAQDPLGWGVLAAVVLLQILGAWWLRRIMRLAV